ncbi:MAG: YbaK/EbsC family protein, partial [candidate division WOR-3 bacterium]
DKGEKVELNYEMPELVYTPNARSVEEVCTFLGIEPKYLVKTLVYITDEEPVMVLVRGDHEVNENKLAQILKNPRLATPEEVKGLLEVDVGFVGPVDVKMRKIADNSIKYMKGFVVGANKPNYHLIGVSLDDIEDVEFHDIRMVARGDMCPKCGEELSVKNAIEVGHIFKLGTRYSESMGVYFTDKDGDRKPVIMGSYGIGPGRIMASAVELYGTEDSMIWPKNISPFDVHIIDIVGEGDEVYEVLQKAGFDVLWDDRRESAGVKFKDADLIGVPIRVVIGKHWEEDRVEVQDISKGESKIIHRENLINFLKEA